MTLLAACCKVLNSQDAYNEKLTRYSTAALVLVQLQNGRTAISTLHALRLHCST